jgi:hypothetical protein
VHGIAMGEIQLPVALTLYPEQCRRHTHDYLPKSTRIPLIGHNTPSSFTAMVPSLWHAHTLFHPAQKPVQKIDK